MNTKELQTELLDEFDLRFMNEIFDKTEGLRTRKFLSSALTRMEESTREEIVENVVRAFIDYHGYSLERSKELDGEQYTPREMIEMILLSVKKMEEEK